MEKKKVTQNATLVPIITALEGAFAKMNKDIFESALSTPVITVQCGARQNAYGWVSVQKVWHDTQDSYVELNVSAEYLNRPVAEIMQTLLHEMVHISNQQQGIQDVSRSSQYHNSKFKAEAEKRGLVCTHHQKTGYVTAASDATLSYFSQNFDSLSSVFSLYRDEDGRKTSSGKKSSTRKYVCPHCGLSVRATKVVHVMCLDCACELIWDRY